jgi:UDP-N-acetylmuramate: L-alanyl-gamma-D-glutamyl-meso-diaminopimelate ligase
MHGLREGDRLHVLGVAGTAMASLAGLLNRLGYRVSGSDQGAYPPMSTVLEREGIDVRTPFGPENLPGDCRAVIVGNAISRGNPELEAALDRRLPLHSFPETLRELVLRPRVPVVVAGTHGKTTTTSLLAWILRASGRDAGYLVGGVADDLGGSFALGAPGEPFVVEGDEYDTAYWDKGPKFLHYLPEVAIVGNVEFDHADIYPDFAAVRRQFSFLSRLPPRRGLLLLGADSAAAAELAGAAHTTVQTFSVAAGDGAAADWEGTIEHGGPAGSRLAVRFRGAPWPALEGRFWGRAAARNVLAAAAAADWLGVEWKAIREAVLGFSGVQRRLQRLAASPDGRLIVVRDFAHHPTAVEAVLEAASHRWPDAPLVAVFEPRSFTARSAVFQARFVEAFRRADRVLLASPAGERRGRRLPSTASLDLDGLARDLDAAGTPAEVMDDHDALLRRVGALAGAGDAATFLFLSNGHFGGVPEQAAAIVQG